MNIKLVSVIAALAVSAAVAQDNDEYEEASEPATESYQEEEEAAPEPAPVVRKKETVSIAETQSATEEASTASSGSLDALHGAAYNMVGNEGGASTVRGDMAAPYKMAGRSLIYVEPTNQYGALALTSGSFTYLLAFNNATDDVGLLTAGLATKSFGLTVDLALAKHWASSEEKGENNSSKDEASLTEDGDNIGLTFAAPLGGIDFVANVYWQTFAADADAKSDGSEVKSSKWDLGGAITFSNGPSAKKTFWSVGADFLRHEDSQETKGNGQTVETTNPGAYMMIMPRLNLAFTLAQKEDARLLAGLNTRLPVILFDKIENKPNKEEDSYSIFGLYTSPNLLAEMSLTENWIIFGGASIDWEVISYATSEYKRDTYTEDGSIISMKSGSALANAGARFQYKMLSLEASIAENLNNNNWAGLIGNFSAMLTF